MEESVPRLPDQVEVDVKRGPVAYDVFRQVSRCLQVVDLVLGKVPEARCYGYPGVRMFLPHVIYVGDVITVTLDVEVANLESEWRK